MNAQELMASTETSWKSGVKQQLLALWKKAKKLGHDIEHSMDHYDETYLRGL